MSNTKEKSSEVELIDIEIKTKGFIKHVETKVKEGSQSFLSLLVAAASIGLVFKFGILYGMAVFLIAKVTQVVHLLLKSTDSADHIDSQEQRENRIYDDGFSEGYLRGVQEKVKILAASAKGGQVLSTEKGDYN